MGTTFGSKVLHLGVDPVRQIDPETRKLIPRRPPARAIPSP